MAEQPSEFIMVFVTASTATEAQAIAQVLITEKLAACVALSPIESIYHWQGEVERSPEWQLMIKTHQSRFSVLETRIKSLHSYEVPEIIALPMSHGSPEYLQWLKSTVTAEES